MLRPLRRPLIILSPKSLLRHPLAVSQMTFFAEGRSFQTVINDPDPIDAKAIKRVVICSGKVYYELVQARRTQGMKDVALLRLEQLYPFPNAALSTALKRFTQCEQFIWCQEEPQNQGAWDQIKHRLIRSLPDHQPILYVGRASSAAPASGYPYLHQMLQETLVEDALHGTINPLMNKRLT